MNIDRQRLRYTAKMTLLCVLFLFLIRWLTRQELDLFDPREYVFFAAGIAVGAYAVWPSWKGRRG